MKDLKIPLCLPIHYYNLLFSLQAKALCTVPLSTVYFTCSVVRSSATIILDIFFFHPGSIQYSHSAAGDINNILHRQSRVGPLVAFFPNNTKALKGLTVHIYTACLPPVRAAFLRRAPKQVNDGRFGPYL